MKLRHLEDFPARAPLIPPPQGTLTQQTHSYAHVQKQPFMHELKSVFFESICCFVVYYPFLLIKSGIFFKLHKMQFFYGTYLQLIIL